MTLNMLNENLDFILNGLTQIFFSGGIHVPAINRLLLFCLARIIDAKIIIETGYDAGYTTEALALTGAQIVGLDNLSEYPGAETIAQPKLEKYSNITLLHDDALEYLKSREADSIDLIFIDDDHSEDHVKNEILEARRIVSAGGVIVLHDVFMIPHIKVHANRILHGFDKILIPNISPVTAVTVPALMGNCGMGIYMKPLGITECIRGDAGRKPLDN